MSRVLSSTSYFFNHKKLVKYFAILTVSFHDINAIFGFFIFLTIFSQIISGIMLSFSLIPEAMLTAPSREEEDIENMYTDDFFWLHERGVDYIFIFSYGHIARKIYIYSLEIENESAWKSGVFTFLVLQAAVFLGLVLCCTHLSEITLTIATNIIHTFFLFTGKAYWWFFTDQQLNTDTLIRLAYAHYVVGIFAFILGVYHGLDMHYDWRANSSDEALRHEMVWWEEALSNELYKMFVVFMYFILFAWWVFHEPEALSYEIFMWGDIGNITDVRYYSVAPHWYYRAFMAWLILCPHHKTGVFGLVLFFIVLYYQPVIHNMSYRANSFIYNIILWVRNRVIKIFDLQNKVYDSATHYKTTYYIFLTSAVFTMSALPYGRFFNRLGGIDGMMCAYLYIFCYLSFPFLRRSKLFDMCVENLKHRYSMI